MEKIAEVIKVNLSDRLIYIEYGDENEVVGLNYMQGADDYDHFKPFMKNDPDILEFFKVMERAKLLRDKNLIQKIEEAIWLKIELEDKGYTKQKQL